VDSGPVGPRPGGLAFRHRAVIRARYSHVARQAAFPTAINLLFYSFGAAAGCPSASFWLITRNLPARYPEEKPLEPLPPGVDKQLVTAASRVWKGESPFPPVPLSAAHWYHAVEQSSGFQPYQPKAEPLPAELEAFFPRMPNSIRPPACGAGKA